MSLALTAYWNDNMDWFCKWETQKSKCHRRLKRFRAAQVDWFSAAPVAMDLHAIRRKFSIVLVLVQEPVGRKWVSGV